MNPTADIVTALCKHLEDEQTFSPALRVAYPLRQFDPAPDETYLHAFVLSAPVDSRAVGTGRDLLSGVFQVSITFTHKNEGLITPLDLAGEIAKQFKKGTQLYTTGGLKIKVSRTPDVAQVVTDSVRPLIPVSIPYEVSVRNDL